MSKILVPVDYSKSSFIAYEEAIVIAKQLQSDLVLLFVHETSLFQSNDYNEIIESGLKLKLKELGKGAEKQGMKVDYLVKTGKPHKIILEVSEHLKPKFIIMGGHGETGFQEKLMGSTTTKVVAQAKFPVFIFKAKRTHNGFDEIILPLDLSKETKQKVKYAVEIAKAFNSTITVCSVLYNARLDAKLKLESQLAEVEEKIKAKNIKCHSQLLIADYLPKAIIDFAESGGANGIQGDLILLMTQQEKSIGEYLIGSFASKILNSSKTPILSICPKVSNTVYTIQSM